MAKQKQTIEAPKVGSAWNWQHLPDQGRIVEKIITRGFGGGFSNQVTSFVLYSETHEGKRIDLKLTTLSAWDNAAKGKRPYLSPLLPKGQKSSRDQIIKAWGQAEKDMGKFVNLNEEGIRNFYPCPPEMLRESILSHLQRR